MDNFRLSNERNIQSPEPKAEGDGMTLEVHSLFHTIQGEGIFSGMPAVFIRLAGCNLQCPGCDTEYTQGRIATPLAAILDRAHELFPETPFERPRLVVITGGEPFRQNIAPLVRAIIERAAMVQIETNGTFAPPANLHTHAKIVCSPKAGKVADSLVPRISAYKYVLEDGEVSEADGLPTSILGKPGHRPARPSKNFAGPVYLSPMDSGSIEQNFKNTQAAVKSCLKFGYILNLQLHKLVGLP